MNIADMLGTRAPGLPADALIAPERSIGDGMGGKKAPFLRQAIQLDSIDPDVRMSCPLSGEASHFVMSSGQAPF
ncbi:hypothetical protein [Rhodocista pekingensis]|uniref:Uncharacterized protein n=1 Tax=Rhodocista pekingensis TaxID=201185 RepID=A0ABW2KXN1_9PROT